jgi:L-ribulokinase
MNQPQTSYVIGIDYGTDSVRALLADAADGTELASSVHPYARWAKGLYCDPAKNQFRQHPLDYTEGLESVVKECLKKAGPGAAAKVRALSVDTTGSTPVAVNKYGVPLSLISGYEENPNAMFILWKDHTAVEEAAQINRHAAQFPVNYLEFAGGVYSSEWYWAKLLHILRHDAILQNEVYSFAEHCDWIPHLLTGGGLAANIKRGRCSAGHKALWSATYGGYPPLDWFVSLDPVLAPQVARLHAATYTADQPAGTLSAEWAERLGLSTRVIIGCGAFDAHMGAVGGQIEPGYLSKVMGTSTCDILVAPVNEKPLPAVKGICGQVEGSVIPGMTGFEAGQSAFGDTYAWFKKILAWPLDELLLSTSLINPGFAKMLHEEISDKIITKLSQAAAKLPPEQDAETALDWLNGRRTPDASQQLKASIAGLNLATDAPRIFRALAEGTCFGARAIVERFRSEGIPIQGITGIGGVAKKSPYIMQLMAEVLGMPIRIHASEQTCAMGAAMFAATAAGIYPNVEAAMAAMGQGFDKIYEPNPSLKQFYDKRYQKYQRLGWFTEEDIHEQ